MHQRYVAAQIASPPLLRVAAGDVGGRGFDYDRLSTLLILGSLMVSGWACKTSNNCLEKGILMVAKIRQMPLVLRLFDLALRDGGVGGLFSVLRPAKLEVRCVFSRLLLGDLMARGTFGISSLIDLMAGGFRLSVKGSIGLMRLNVRSRVTRSMAALFQSTEIGRKDQCSACDLR